METTEKTETLSNGAFSSMIGDSLDQNTAAPVVAVAEPRQRGRKKGCAAWNKGKGKKNSTEGMGEGAFAPSLPSEPPPPQADYTPVFKRGIAFASSAVVKKTGCELVALDSDEQTEIAASVEGLRKKYLPNLDQGEMGPELAFVLAVGMICGTKYFVYSGWKAEQKKEAEKEVEAENAETTPADFSHPFPIQQVL